jgi:hypothetical protein
VVAAVGLRATFGLQDGDEVRLEVPTGPGQGIGEFTDRP